MTVSIIAVDGGSVEMAVVIFTVLVPLFEADSCGIESDTVLCSGLDFRFTENHAGGGIGNIYSFAPVGRIAPEGVTVQSIVTVGKR